MTGDPSTDAELNELLSRAVDRQIAEQRALRQSLDDLRESVRDLAARPAAARVDLTVVEERLESMARSLAERPAGPDLSALEDRLRTAVQATVTGASETTFASLSDQLRSLREIVVPRLEHAAETNEAVRTMAHDIAAVREVVGGVATDIEGIAQALIDFNAGLRSWAQGMDESVSSIRQTVGELHALAAPRARPEGGPDETAPSEAVTAEGEEPGREAAIEERIKETAEHSEYLADQIEDLDGLMGRLSELPQQLEGVVSQALKRTLTARAKLDREAETALDDVLAALDEHVNQLSSVLERFEQEEDHIRKIALEQVELTSRIESLQSTFLDRIERVEDLQRRGEEAIAVAIDRTARGLAPRALESLARSTRRRKPPAAAKARGSKTKPAPAAAEAKAKSRAKQPKRKPKAKRARPRRAARQLDWTPLPGDETSA